jgi:BolA family transcriptional regulator, general stress-responsive regulator
MSSDLTGPVAREIDQRLRAALAPTSLDVINDSAKHHGHAGDDGSGESHFTVEIEAPQFAGMSRLERQRAVNAALGDLMRERVHALAIKARAPGEPGPS